MGFWLKQSTAVTVKFGPFLDDTDGKTEETGLTISQADIRLSKNGGNIAQSNNVAGATHDELGYYNVPLNTIDTNTLGTLRVAVHKGGALPVWQDFMIVSANAWDSMFGSDKLQVDIVEISGDSVAADNLESDYDGTGLNRSNSTIGTATNVTNAVDILQAAADKVWATTTRTLTSFGTLVADIWNDSISEPSAGAPPATPTRGVGQNWFWMHFRNQGTLNKTTGEAKIYNNAGTVLAKGTDSDDSTTFVKGKLGAP